MDWDRIERRLDAAGTSGFDPRPVLGGLSTPGYWIFGGLDRSIPVARSVRVLDSLRALGRDFESIVIPDLNHVWIRNGTICQDSGPGGVDGAVIASWLWPRLGRAAPPARGADHQRSRRSPGSRIIGSPALQPNARPNASR